MRTRSHRIGDVGPQGPCGSQGEERGGKAQEGRGGNRWREEREPSGMRGERKGKGTGEEGTGGQEGREEERRGGTETGRGQEERRMAKAKEEGKKRTFPTSY